MLVNAIAVAVWDRLTRARTDTRMKVLSDVKGKADYADHESIGGRLV